MFDESIIACTDDNKKVRLYIRMDCSEGAAMAAGQWFNDLSQKLRTRFPEASIATRQGLRVYALQDGDEENMFVRVTETGA